MLLGAEVPAAVCITALNEHLNEIANEVLEVLAALDATQMPMYSLDLSDLSEPREKSKSPISWRESLAP